MPLQSGLQLGNVLSVRTVPVFSSQTSDEAWFFAYLFVFVGVGCGYLSYCKDPTTRKRCIVTLYLYLACARSCGGCVLHEQ